MKNWMYNQKYKIPRKEDKRRAPWDWPLQYFLGFDTKNRGDKNKYKQVRLHQIEKLCTEEKKEKAAYGMREKTCKPHIWWVNVKHTRNLYNSIERKWIKTWTNYLIEHFPRRHTSDQQVCEKALSITNNQDNSNQNQHEISPHTC